VYQVGLSLYKYIETLGQQNLKFVSAVHHCFSTAGPRPGTGPWHQLYRAARGLRKL